MIPMKVIDSHSHWFSVKVMSEKEFIMASAESWGEGEISADVMTMNKLRPFYLYLKNELIKLLGENFIEERNRMIRDDPYKYLELLFKDAQIEGIVIDTGFGKKEIEIKNVKIKLLFRIETIINKLFALPFDKALEVFEETLREKKSEGYSGFKSIIAYRTGLKVTCEIENARRDFMDNKRDWYGKIAKGFRDYLLCETLRIAKELGVPVQIHTGAGDRDIKFELTRPSYLTDLVRKYEGIVVLTHGGYPYHRESAWMSYIFPSVYLDTSQVIPFAPLAAYSVLREIFEVAPLNKVMHGSDAFNIPEIAWLGSKLAKKAILKVANELVEKNILNEKESEELINRFLYNNAKAVYKF